MMKDEIEEKFEAWKQKGFLTKDMDDATGNSYVSDMAKLAFKAGLHSTLEEGFRDSITSDVTIHLSFVDKIKVLFGFNFDLRVVVFCENVVGKVKSSSDIHIYRPKKSKSVGFMHSVEDEMRKVEGE